MIHDEDASVFHVFLSHNGKDKPSVKNLAKRLRALGFLVWLDMDNLIAGHSLMQQLEQGIRNSNCAAVLVGKDGLGPWQIEETESLLNIAMKEGKPVIPVLLPGAANRPDLPAFLNNRVWVDLRGGLAGCDFDKLVQGITGKQPGKREDRGDGAMVQQTPVSSESNYEHGNGRRQATRAIEEMSRESLRPSISTSNSANSLVLIIGAILVATLIFLAIRGVGSRPSNGLSLGNVSAVEGDLHVISFKPPNTMHKAMISNTGPDDTSVWLRGFPEHLFYTNFLNERSLIETGEDRVLSIVFMQHVPNAFDYAFYLDSSNGETLDVSIRLEGDWHGHIKNQIALVADRITQVRRTNNAATPEQIYTTVRDGFSSELNGVPLPVQDVFVGRLLDVAGETELAAVAVERADSRDQALTANFFRDADNPALFTALGERYVNGSATLEANPARGAHWLSLAAEAGASRAQFRLGNLYRLGSGVAMDKRLAEHWLRQAVQANEPGAALDLAALLGDELQPKSVNPIGVNAILIRLPGAGCPRQEILSNQTKWGTHRYDVCYTLGNDRYIADIHNYGTEDPSTIFGWKPMPITGNRKTLWARYDSADMMKDKGWYPSVVRISLSGNCSEEVTGEPGLVQIGHIHGKVNWTLCVKKTPWPSPA